MMCTADWSKLPIDVVTDKTPPGWYFGCETPYLTWKDSVDRWMKMCNYDKEDAIISALQFRLSGEAKNTAKSGKGKLNTTTGVRATETMQDFWDKMDIEFKPQVADTSFVKMNGFYD